MAEKHKEKSQKQEKPVQGKHGQTEKAGPPVEEQYEDLVRILGYDIPSQKPLYPGLTRIKGVSWAIANALCISLALPKQKKIETLTKEEIHKIESFLRNLPVSDYLKNRRLDPETGESKHYLGSDLEIKKEFDIKRLREMRSYKGIRHAAKLPVRGQRTRSHFRTRGIAMGVKRKAK